MGTIGRWYEAQRWWERGGVGKGVRGTYRKEGRHSICGHGSIDRQQVLEFPEIEEIHAVHLDEGLGFRSKSAIKV
jgi:hypothetical protein